MTAMTTITKRQLLTGTWALDPAHTRLGFSARHAMVATVRGSFTDVSGVLRLDARDPSRSTADITIDAVSLDSGSADRDKHLRSADFLDVETYPTLHFVSTAVRPVRDDEYVLTGNLTIRDATREVGIAITLVGTEVDPFGNVRAGFEGTAEISRKDFGLTWNVALESGGVLVSDRVKISLDVSAIKTADADEQAVSPAA
jgi:polyisoprenoid-binding protein YceI